MKVRVKNLDSREYVEIFRDVEIRIPGHGYIEMGRSEAIKFLSQATPMNVDGAGRCLKPKKLVLEEDPELHAAARDQPIRYEAPDGKQFRTKKGYEAYLENFKNLEINNEQKPVRRRRKSSAAAKDGAGLALTGQVESGSDASK